MNKIKWILFDVGGVLVQLILTNPEGYTVGSRHFDQKDLEGFYYTKEINNYMLGLISHEQFIGKYLHRKKLDISVDELNQVIQEDIKPVSGMKELIETLSKKYSIGLATNDGSLISKYKIEKSGVLPYLSKVIASYRIREVKPNIAFYKKTLEIIGASPSECIFIDDTQENVNAANAIGMKGILFTNVPQLERDLSILHI